MLHRRPLAVSRLLAPATPKPPQADRPGPTPANMVGDVLDTLATSPSLRLLKPEEVAAMLGVSERTLERWRMVGGGPGFVSLSRKTVRYTAQAIHAFIQERLKTSTAQ